MRIVISYDISNDKRRRKVAKMMEGYGFRVQYSVFECELDEKKLQQLQQRLKPYIKESEEESIRFYPLTADAAQKVSVLGKDLRKVIGSVVIV